MFTSSKNHATAAATAAALALAVFGIIAAPARGGTVTYATTNLNAGDGTGASALNANFIFAISSGDVSVQINNTTANTASDAEEIYGLSFNLTDAHGNAVTLPVTPGYTLTNGYEVSLSENGKGRSARFNSSTPIPVNELTMSKPWLTAGSGDTVFLHVGTSKPNDMVIAPPPNSGDYGNLGGLNSVLQHNPSLVSGVTFNLDIPNAAANDVISNVVVQYGTTPDTTDPHAVPEPASLVVSASGVGALLLRRRRGRSALLAKK